MHNDSYLNLKIPKGNELFKEEEIEENIELELEQ